MENTKSNLLDALQALQASHGNAWIASLEARKQEEIIHSDKYHSITHAETESEYSSAYRSANYYLGTKKSDDFLNDWISKNAPGKVLLDMACGNGLLAIKAAECGSDLAIGIDLSPLSIKNAKDAADKAGVGGKTFFLVGDVEDTGLPENSVDLVMCSGMLHHIDLNRFLPELQRILKPGGKVFVFEPLGYNPIIQLYRRATPHIRTHWETAHIIGLKDVSLARNIFLLKMCVSGISQVLQPRMCLHYYHYSTLLIEY